MEMLLSSPSRITVCTSTQRARRCCGIVARKPFVRPAPSRDLLRCRYTSLPERMSENEEDPSAAVPEGADTPEELHKRDEARRVKEREQQARSMDVLHDLEAAAVKANPEAGHPESRRALDATDYPAPAPRPTAPAGAGNWIEPQVAHGLPWPGIPSSGEDQQQVSDTQTARTDVSSGHTAVKQKTNDSIYHDNSPFESWFDKP